MGYSTVNCGMNQENLRNKPYAKNKDFNENEKIDNDI